MNGVNFSASYDGKRQHKASGSGSGGPAAPELDLNGSTSLSLQSQRRGSGNHSTQMLRDAIAQTPATASPHPPSGQQQQQQRMVNASRGGLKNISRDETAPNGMLLGSLAGYLPSPAVALANASAQQQQQQEPQSASTSHASSPRAIQKTHTGAVEGGGNAAAAAAQQDIRNSRQSITVLNVTRGGPAQDDTRPPSNASMKMNGSMSDVLGGGPALPQCKASFNQVEGNNGGGGRLHAPPPRVQRESIAPIPISDASTSTNLSAMAHNRLPPSSAYRQQSPQQQQQRGNDANTSARQPNSRARTVSPKQQQQQQPSSRSSPVPQPARNTSTSPHPQRHHHHYQHQSAQTSGALVPVTAPQPYAARDLPPSSHVLTTPAQYASSHGAVLHHRPSPTAVAQHRGGANVISAGPVTMQVSTTTLTKTCKKVRYLLPDEPFDPDAPDPSDKGGLSAAEEEALLDPVNYTRAADGVASRYPMLLRRPSAQGGDLLRGRRGSGGPHGDSDNDSGAPRPTFLLDDGNRWARETNRPTVASTRDPAGGVLTQLPSPSILQKSQSSRHHDNPAPFPAYQQVVSADGTDGTTAAAAGEYLLQRHVQQMATGRQLVEGTVFQPPGMTQRQRERRQREEAEDERAAAAQRDAPSSSRKRIGSANTATAEAGNLNPRRGPTDGLYEEIIRRANQNRRAALPTKVMMPPTAGTVMPPLAPPTAAAVSSSSSSRPPVVPQQQQQQQQSRGPAPPPSSVSSGRRRGRQHPNSAEPTPLHKGSGVRPSQHDGHLPHDHYQQQQQYLPPPPPRSSSQPYITSNYVEGTPTGSDASGTPQDNNRYYTPNMEAEYYPPPRQQQQQQQQRPPLANRRPQHPPASAALYQHPALAPPPPSSQQQQQQRQQRPSPSSPLYISSRPPAPSSNSSSNTVPTQRRPVDALLQDSPLPCQQQPPLPSSSSSLEARPDYSAASTAPSMPGYISGRFSKYDLAGTTLALPPPPPTAPAAFSETAATDDNDYNDDHVDRRTAHPPARRPVASTRPALPPPPPPPALQQQQQQVKRQRRTTATPPPAEEAPYQEQQQQSRDQQDVVPIQQHYLPPPPPPQQQPLSSQRSSASRRNTCPPPPTPPTAASSSSVAVPTTAAVPYASSYDDNEATNDRDDYVEAAAEAGMGSHTYDDDEDDSAFYQTDDDEVEEEEEEDPVTDAAGVRTPRLNSAIAGTDAGMHSVGRPHNSSSGSAGAEVRRSLLDQYNNGDDDNSQDTPRGTPRRHPQQQQQQQKPPQPSAPASTGRQDVTYERVNAPARPLPPQPPASTAAVAAAGAPPGAGEEPYENAPSMTSCETGTQPVTVSERGDDEVDEGDYDLAKKGPVLLRIGDEVYAPEGYVEVEDEEGEDENYDDVEGDTNGNGEDELSYGDAAAEGQRNSSVRYDEFNDEL
jgi:hypothetical protein